MPHEVLEYLKKIPRGKVTAYAELARIYKTSPRAIGAIMRNNMDPQKYPCYKVVMSDGRIGGYSGRSGVKRKKKLLMKEGINITGNKIDTRFMYFFKNH